jgi:hypothetical protein
VVENESMCFALETGSKERGSEADDTIVDIGAGDPKEPPYGCESRVGR